MICSLINVLFLDPFFEIRRNFPGFPGSTLLYRSEVKQQELNPNFQPFDVSLLMTGGLDTPFTVTMFDSNESGVHTEIGMHNVIVILW